ncbi:CDK-activating kinase assembly factor MAT1 isoform X2 [Meleagris gallopavo]|uniref:CDK-activating kinase assembly factor MAT1 isoform X2 n=1 Tax=Meleagris gallopavo TaxID=9103 RepID=UPI0012AB6914|nr:CDK-activating kinase assembly factor MAT1 isoform X2 [Meleagris gallopavo]
MDEQGCPRCKTTKYRNPSLKLMVNVCGHTLCESCVELLFVRGAGNCHECDTPLRKSNFRVQLFDDPAVDKEVEIRKKVLKIYNKREDDFPSLSEYNDFLEEIEEIVFNLTNNVDLENTKRKMELYQKDNKEVIQKNKIKLTREQEELEEALEVERQENEQRRLLEQKEEQLQQMMKRKNKQALLDELRFIEQLLDVFCDVGLALTSSRACTPQVGAEWHYSTWQTGVFPLGHAAVWNHTEVKVSLKMSSIHLLPEPRASLNIFQKFLHVSSLHGCFFLSHTENC